MFRKLAQLLRPPRVVLVRDARAYIAQAIPRDPDPVVAAVDLPGWGEGPLMGAGWQEWDGSGSVSWDD